MTPNLLDELEKIVALSEKATPGPWLYRGKSNSWHAAPPEGSAYSYGHFLFTLGGDEEDTTNGWDEPFLVAAVQFMRTHAPALADMAKRLEAAERDAARYRFLRDGEHGEAEIKVVAGYADGCDYYEGDSLDAAVDADMAHYAAIDAAQEGEG